LAHFIDLDGADANLKAREASSSGSKDIKARHLLPTPMRLLYAGNKCPNRNNFG
jgi:hypothetical protein